MGKRFQQFVSVLALVAIVYLSTVFLPTGVAAADTPEAFIGPVTTVAVVADVATVPLIAAQANGSSARWYGVTQQTGCYGGKEVHLWTYQAPMWGAWITFDSGYAHYYGGLNWGSGSWEVIARDYSRPATFVMDWKYNSGPVTVYCWS